MKTIIKTVALSGVMLSLMACHSMGNKDNDLAASVVDFSEVGVTSHGAGQQAEFTGEDTGNALPGSGSALATKTKLGDDQTYYFDFNRDSVNSDDRAAIDKHAKYLLAHPKATILVEGHTDSRGSREYNIGLGERRAETVARVLEADGVPKKQIRIISYGEEKPAVLGQNEQSYGKNRRVFIVYEARA